MVNNCVQKTQNTNNATENVCMHECMCVYACVLVCKGDKRLGIELSARDDGER